MSTTETAAASNSSMEVETSDISIDSEKERSDHNILEREHEIPIPEETCDDESGTACGKNDENTRDTPTPDLIFSQDTSVDPIIKEKDVDKSPEQKLSVSEMESSEHKVDIPEKELEDIPEKELEDIPEKEFEDISGKKLVEIPEKEPPENQPDVSESDKHVDVVLAVKESSGNKPTVSELDENTVAEIKESQNDMEQETRKKRKAEEDTEYSENMEKLKKSRQSCVIVYEGKPQATTAPMLDLTVEATPPPSENITLNESQEFSLRYDEDISPISQPDRVKVRVKNNVRSSLDSDRNELLLAEITTLKARLEQFKTENTELRSQIEKLKEKNESFEAELEASFPSSKEGVHTFTEKCPLFGTVFFTVDDRTKQIIRAQVKQLSLLDECLPVSDDKNRTSLSSGVLADRSFQSNSSNVSVPGPFPLPLPRKSVMSAVSSSTSSSGLSSVSAAFKKHGLRNWNSQYTALHPPAARLGSVHCRAETLSCGLGCTKTFPHVDLPSPSPSSENTPVSPETNVLSAKEEHSDTEITVKNGTQQTNGEAENTIKNGENLEDEKQDQVMETPQRQSALKAKRKRQPATTSKPSTVKRTLPLKPTSTEKSGKKKSSVAKPGGRQVFARWTDGKYYPGFVYSEAGSTLKVHFCDGNVKEVTPLKVIPAQWLVAGTTALAATTAEGAYEPYLIVSIEECDEGRKYTLEQDSKSCVVLFAKLALTEAQVQDIKQPPTDNTGAAVPTQKLHMFSLDNVLDKPRTRRPVTTSGAAPKRRKNSSVVEPSTSNNLITTQETQQIQHLSTTDSEYSTEPSFNDNIQGFEMHPLDRESSPPTVAAHLKGKLSVGRPGKSRKDVQEDASITEELGPIPEAGSYIFLGNNFLITYTEKKKTRKVQRADREKYKSDSTDYTSGTSDLENSVGPFNKERLRTQIRRGGGRLYNSIEQVPTDELDKTVLITDAPSCTPLYIQCVAKGIPTYSHDIIVRCCSENASFSKLRQNVPMLPSGWSLERQVWVERSKNIRHAWVGDSKTTKLLQNMLILLAVNQNEANIKFWKKILIDIGAKVQLYNDNISAKSLMAVSIIVSDNECSSNLLEQAEKLEIPVVSLTWVQQCIIDNDVRPYMNHPAYSYHYISEPESPEY